MATASVTAVEARADGRAALASAQTTVRGPPDAAAPSRPVDGASADAIPATSASATGEDAEALAALLPPTDRALGDDLAWLVDRRVLPAAGHLVDAGRAGARAVARRNARPGRPPTPTRWSGSRARCSAPWRRGAPACFDWNVGVSLQRYRAGPRPDLGLQVGFEMPIAR